MLAYLFWHRPRAGESRAGYEQAARAFQRSLTRNPPAGSLANVSVRVTSCPWLEGDGGDTYEDWYAVEDWTAVGVLERAAVGAGHRSRHDALAAMAGAGAGAVYRLLDGDPGALGAATATWVDAPPGSDPPPLGELLADGLGRERAALWRRALVLGPAPEYCVLAPAPPAGVSASRLPAGWRALTLGREPIAAA